MVIKLGYFYSTATKFKKSMKKKLKIPQTLIFTDEQKESNIYNT